MASDKKTGLIIAVVLVFGFYSCVSTSITTWTDPNYVGGPFHKLAVFAFFKDLRSRIVFEQTMVKILMRNGIQSVATVDLMPPFAKFKDRNKEMARISRDANADGILIFDAMSVRREYSFIPDPDYYYYNYYWGYWGYPYDPGYIETYTTVTVDVRMFSSTTDRLLWAGGTESYGTSNLEDVAQSVAEKVISSLAAKHLIKVLR